MSVEKAPIQARLALPGEDVRIEEVPLAPRKDAGSALRPRLDESLRRQDLHRLADDRAADCDVARDVGAELLLGRDRLAGLEVASEDAHADVVDDRPVQPTPRVRPSFRHTISL